MADGAVPARTSRIMRSPQPHDHNGPVLAEPSSPIPPALAQLAHADPVQHAESLNLLAYLASVPTRQAPVAAATRSSRSWPWPQLRCLPARGR
jgi:hypothetical protein